VSTFGAVWAEAAITFGKNNGHKESLTPFGRTWEQILTRCEHAIRVWDAAHGPLNDDQWKYATELFVAALRHARTARTRAGCTPSSTRG
jgi:hypothetical protein